MLKSSLSPLSRVSALLASGALVALLSGCAQTPPSPNSATANAATSPSPSSTPAVADPARPIRVLATTTLVADVVQAVGGPRVQVETLIGPGLDPHLYKPRESDLRKLSEAELVFFHGLGLEARMGEVLRQHHAALGDSVAIAEAVPENKLRTKGEGQASVDPHVWNDPVLWAFVAKPVQETLAKVDPPHAADYEKRAKDWQESLVQLTVELLAQYGAIPQERRVLVTAHDAFGYLGSAFSLEVRGLQGISTAAEAGAADVDALASFLVDRKVPAVFGETSVPSRGLEALQQAVKARGGQLTLGEELLSDSLDAPGTDGATYPGMMRRNAARITRGLQSTTSTVQLTP
jgi:manganese/zinc/iron transport system substrate-binding protein